MDVETCPRRKILGILGWMVILGVDIRICKTVHVYSGDTIFACVAGVECGIVMIWATSRSLSFNVIDQHCSVLYCIVL